MKSYKICIIGGGPSGMMAGISSAENLKEPEKIAIIDKNNDLGQKLLLTGGGRCNITNEKPIKNQLKLYPEKNFLKPSFFAFDNNDLLKLCDENTKLTEAFILMDKNIFEFIIKKASM